MRSTSRVHSCERARPLPGATDAVIPRQIAAWAGRVHLGLLPRCTAAMRHRPPSCLPGSRRRSLDCHESTEQGASIGSKPAFQPSLFIPMLMRMLMRILYHSSTHSSLKSLMRVVFCLTLAIGLTGCSASSSEETVTSSPVDSRRSLSHCAAGREDLQGHLAVGLRAHGLRHLPRTRERVRAAARRPCRPAAGAQRARLSQRALAQVPHAEPRLLLRRRRHAHRRLRSRRPRRHAARSRHAVPSSPRTRWPMPRSRTSSRRCSRAAYADEFRACSATDIFATRRPPSSARCSRCRSTSRKTPRSSRPSPASTMPFSPARRGAERAGAARPGAVQRSAEGQLRGLPSERARRGRRAAAVHRLHLRQPRRAAQPGHPRQRRSGLLRPRPVRARPHRSRPTRTDLCGAFKVPTLRNVALTAPYFHNGRFATLREVRALLRAARHHPEECYPLDAGGQPRKFNDLPPEYAATSTRPKCRTTAARRHAGARAKPRSRTWSRSCKP